MKGSPTLINEMISLQARDNDSQDCQLGVGQRLLLLLPRLFNGAAQRALPAPILRLLHVHKDVKSSV